MARSADDEVRYGLARLRENWLNQAETHFDAALSRSPGHVSAMHLKGVVCRRLGRHEEGLDWLRRASALAPENAVVWLDLSVALRGDGLTEQADKALDRAVALHAGFTPWKTLPTDNREIYSFQRAVHRQKVVEYDYAATVRYGAGRPPLEHLARDLKARHGTFSERLRRIAASWDDFAGIPAIGDYSTKEPFWLNTWFPPLDAMALTGFLCEFNPARFVEVGSGMSTKVAHRAIRRNGLRTKILSIDPMPRSQIDEIADRIVRAPFETVRLDFVDELEPGDILFIDSSHRTFQNSDVTVFFLEVLPRVRPGVLIHIHDIYLPEDYISGHVWRLWNEQYMLATALLFGGDSFETLFPCWYVSTDPELSALKDELLRRPPHDRLSIHGASYWLTKR